MAQDVEDFCSLPFTVHVAHGGFPETYGYAELFNSTLVDRDKQARVHVTGDS